MGRGSMAEEPAFYSILFAGPQDEPAKEIRTAPECFRDLNLDQVAAALTVGREHYDLQPFLYAPLKDRASILYRQEVFQDIENDRVRVAISAFAAAMSAVRGHLAQAGTLHHPLQKQRWLLDAVKTYCDAVAMLLSDLADRELISRGLKAFREHLRRLTQSSEFLALIRETTDLLAQLAATEYGIVIRGAAISVRRYQGEPDYSEHVLNTFERFKQSASTDYRVEFRDDPQMNHIEENILDRVAALYPQRFEALAVYSARHAEFRDETVARFDREIQLYLSYLEYIAPLRGAGLPFCYPDVSAARKGVFANASFDLALAAKLCAQATPVVGNDVFLEDSERIIVVSGPNQGGKSTFARMFGQLHYLALLGVLVPGREARLFLCDRVFTHFEREEDITAEHGKLEDDLLRIHSILTQATSGSVVILNEIFTSTTLRDAISLSRAVLARLIRLDVLCVWVTFIDELAAAGPQTVSMMSTVAPDNPAVRTYKVIRQPASGRAYALSIAQRYGLTYDSLKERIRP
jgi:DNA mismatch repair protein MutS